MRRILISSIFIVLTTCVLHAQNVKFGIRGGMNVTHMSVAESTPISEGYNSRIAPAWGVFTDLQLNQTFSFRFGVEYSSLGGKRDGTQALPSQQFITDIGNSIGMGISDQQLAALGALMMNLPPYYYANNVDNVAKFDYFTLPLLAQFGRNIGETPWSVYVNVGPLVSFTLSGKQIAEGTSRMYSDASATETIWEALSPQIQGFVANEFPDIDEKMSSPVVFGETNTTGELKSINFGIAANAGLRHQSGKNYLFLEVGGNYGFRTVQDNEDNGSNRLGAVSVMIGYAFSLF